MKLDWDESLLSLRVARLGEVKLVISCGSDNASGQPSFVMLYGKVDSARVNKSMQFSSVEAAKEYAPKMALYAFSLMKSQLKHQIEETNEAINKALGMK